MPSSYSTAPERPGLSRLKRDSATRARFQWKPLALTLCFLILMLLITLQLFGEQLQPAIAVDSQAVLLLPEQNSAAAPATEAVSSMLFQSSGWVEPDPWFVRVPALADGIVESVHFQEGDLVEKDQLLVRLIDEDVKLKLAHQEQQLRQQRLQQNSAAAALQEAKLNLEAARARLDSAQAAMEEAADTWQRVQDLEGEQVLTEAETVQAEQRFRQRQADRKEAELGVARAESRLEQQQLQLEVRAAALSASETERSTLQLELSRLSIHAPFRGRIQRRLVHPGSKRMRGMDDPDSSSVAWLYDPEKLQVRVDVPLAEAGKLQLEQRCVISSSLLPGLELEGRVTHIVGQADLNRNTLQAKVAILNPDPRLRPELLCRVAFYGAGESAVSLNESEEALWIPEALVDASQTQTELWVLDPITRKAQLRNIRLGTQRREGYRQVLQGLRANEQLLLNPERPLHAGVRVRIREHNTPSDL